MGAEFARVDRHEAPVDRSLVRSLALEYGQPEPVVERMFLEELGRLAADARINTFVTVLATSSVRLRLREEAAPAGPAPPGPG